MNQSATGLHPYLGSVQTGLLSELGSDTPPPAGLRRPCTTKPLPELVQAGGSTRYGLAQAYERVYLRQARIKSVGSSLAPMKQA